MCGFRWVFVFINKMFFNVLLCETRLTESVMNVWNHLCTTCENLTTPKKIKKNCFVSQLVCICGLGNIYEVLISLFIFRGNKNIFFECFSTVYFLSKSLQCQMQCHGTIFFSQNIYLLCVWCINDLTMASPWGPWQQCVYEANISCFDLMNLL